MNNTLIHIGLLLGLLISSHISFAQNEEATIDSLKNIVNSSDNDSLKLEALTDWRMLIHFNQPDLELQINQQMIEIASRNFHKDASSDNYYSFKFVAGSINSGSVYVDRREFDIAIKYYDRALRVAEKMGNARLLATVHLNMGGIYDQQSNNPVALEHYDKSLAYAVESDYKMVEIAIRGNKASIFTEVYDSLTLENRDNLADVYLDSATVQYQNVIASCKKHIEENPDSYDLNYSVFTAIALNATANIFIKKNKFDQAREYSFEALSISQDIEDPQGVAYSYEVLATLYSARKNYKKAIEYGEKGKTIAKGVQDAEAVQNISELLYQSYKQLGESKLALLNYEDYIAQRDSTNKEANQKATIEQIFKFEYEKKAAEDSIISLNRQAIAKAQLGEKSAELKRQDQQIFGLALFGVFVVIMAIFMYRSILQRKKANQIIHEQKKQSDYQKSQILESINYAKTIQHSILPDKAKIMSSLPGFSVLYLPKDIVSGDFYWFHENNADSYLILCDCTGHGVPGAFMSLIGSRLLKEVIIDNQVSDISLVLEKLDLAVLQLLKQDEHSESSDGMDLSILKINKTKNKLEFVGANQDLWIVTDEVKHVKGTMRSIGGWVKRRERLLPFKKSSFELSRIKSIFLSSDGFQDQFGGEEKKKFGRKRFNELVSASNSNAGLTHFETAFKNWKAESEQLDDVSIIRVDLI